MIGSANQKSLEHPSDEPSRRNRRLSQSHPLVGLSSDGLYSDGSSLKTELSAKPIASIGRIILGRIIFGRTFFGRIILRSETLKIITSHKWSRTARVTRSISPTLVQHVIKRDGWKRGKKSLYAQKPYVYVRNKSLYAQKPYAYVRTKSLYAQRPYVYVRIK